MLPDAAEAAHMTLARTQQRVPPVDLDRIVALWPNLSVVLDRLEKPGYLVNMGIRGAEIIVKSDDPPARRHFTIAHEIGHWLLHIGIDGSEVRPGQLHPNVIERWCDRFAVNLLMPREWILPDGQQMRLSSLLEMVLSGPRIYRVSEQAFRLRIAEVTPISVLQVLQFGDKTTVEREYLSDLVDPDRLMNASDWARSLLRDLSGPEHVAFDRRTGMHAVLGLLGKSGETRRWLACLRPASGIGEDTTASGHRWPEAVGGTAVPGRDRIVSPRSHTL
jgi:Zn-dependent peptidase ImmA (M78 family)